MKAMKKNNIILKTWFWVIGFTVGFVLIPTLAFAVPASPITVRFENAPLPLFNKTNFVPGESETRTITVTNNTENEKEVIIEAIHYSACSILPFSPCFAKKLDVKIFSGGETYFEKTLSDFFGAGEISLGKLSAGVTKEYKMRVLFPVGEDDNDYQEKTTGFDLLVGFRGEEGQGSDDHGTVSNGTGGGGGVVLQGLQINNEATVIEQDGSVTVTWTTNYNSYGHVIWSGQDETGTLNLSLPNFGYAHGAPSDPHLVGHTDTAQSLNHSFILSGLAPGTYRYRVVSHASPPTVGYERIFIVPGISKKVSMSEDEIALIQNQDNQGGNTGLVAGASDTIMESENKGSDEAIKLENKDVKNDSSHFAGAITSIGGMSLPWMLGLGFLAFFLGYFLAKKKKE